MWVADASQRIIRLHFDIMSEANQMRSPLGHETLLERGKPVKGHVNLIKENREETVKSHRFGSREYMYCWVRFCGLFKVCQQLYLLALECRYVRSRVSSLFHQSRLIHTMSVIHHTPGAPTLCTLPPECILVIISHLPPSTYTPLVQTSHHFLAFFSTHAATICNNHILTHHALSASYLNSIYLDGWLVPSHPAIAIQERLLLSPPVSPSSQANSSSAIEEANIFIGAPHLQRAA